VDELALLGVDAALLVPDLRHAADVLLGDERALREPLPGEQDVGEGDQELGKIGPTKRVFALRAYQPSAWRVYPPAADP
jgi:hypothetical protein